MMVPQVTRYVPSGDAYWTERAEFSCIECEQDCTEYNVLASGNHGLLCTTCAPVEAGYYAQLTMLGYLDQTAWDGPFINAFRAMRYTCKLHEIDMQGNAR